jgi:hypothetical protein
MIDYPEGDPERPADRSLSKWVVFGVDSHVFAVRELDSESIFTFARTWWVEYSEFLVFQLRDKLKTSGMNPLEENIPPRYVKNKGNCTSADL